MRMNTAYAQCGKRGEDDSGLSRLQEALSLPS